MGSGNDLFSVFIIFLSSINYGLLHTYSSPTANSIKSMYPSLAKYDTQWDWFINGPRLTAMIGTLIFYPVVFYMGRQFSLFLVLLINGVLFLLMIPINDNSMVYLIIIRLLQGIGWGFLSSISLVYIIEMSPRDKFGFCGCMHQFFNVLGMIINNVSAGFLNFRYISLISSLFSFIGCCLIWIIRDSYVTAIDKRKRNSRKRFVFKQKNKTTYVKKDIDNVIESHDESDGSDQIFQWRNVRIMIYGSVMFIFQQFSGTNAILANLSTIMKSSGLGIDSNLQSGMVNFSQLFAVLVPAFLIDLYGPKNLWIISSSLLILFLLLYGITLEVEMPHFLPVLFIFLYRLSFGLGVGPLTYATWAQHFTDSARYIGFSIMMSVHWLTSWAVIKTYPEMNKTMGNFGTIAFYAGITFISIFYGAYFIPEKKKERGDLAVI